MSDAPRVVLCNGAILPAELGQDGDEHVLRLEYEEGRGGPKNVKISLPNFVRSVGHIPDRVLDLLEIAVYVFLADRSTSRGSRTALEYQGWARSLHFVVKVRDLDFWSRDDVTPKLAEALRFMSGDRDYAFTFQPGHSTPPANLFDSAEFKVEPKMNNSVILFSGGLDSLAGVVERLVTTEERLCLVSHCSQTGIKKTQDALFDVLNYHYPMRLTHYKFDCNLAGVPAREETQRTRSFLYSSIAYALSHVLSQQGKFFVYENGVTSINFPKRRDMGNSRSSRTTHPRTISLLQEFFSTVEGSALEVATPYLWRTKTEVFGVLNHFGRKDLITSSVSCGSTRRNLGQDATHCGGCSQCVDRRFGAYGAKLDDTDEGGIYASDFLREKPENEDKTTLIDYVRQARDFADWNVDHFYEKKLNELVDLTDYLPDTAEDEAVERVWELCNRHGRQVMAALKRMQSVHDDPMRKIPEGSLLHLINEREYLKEPVSRLVLDMCERLKVSVPLTFRKHRPKDENDLNDKVSGILNTDRQRFEREHPSVRFALANAVADHSLNGQDLLVESKYVRGSNSPSKASEGISADLTKYPDKCHILFFVYDPDRAISDDTAYKADIEGKRRCTVCVVR
ncbi:MAG: hypothetical protein ACR2JR_06330 [Rubrobacteraceae bacterium]